MTINTQTVAARLATRLAEHGVTLTDAAGFAAAFANDLVEWVGGAEAVPVALATKVTTTATAWNTDVMERIDWWTGPADGGPNGDGLYPMTNAAGVTTLFPSLAKIFATVGTVDDPSAVIAEIEALVVVADAAKDEAGLSAIGAASSAASVAAAAAQIPKLCPSVLDWMDVTVDATGRVVSGVKWNGSVWEARAGVLIQVSKTFPVVDAVPTADRLKVTGLLDAPGILALYPTIAGWKEMSVDLAGRMVWGRKFDNSEWIVSGGVLVAAPAQPIRDGASGSLTNLSVTKLTATEVVAPGVSAYYPTIAQWKSLDLDVTGRPLRGVKLDGSEWEVLGGVFVRVSGDDAVYPTYAYDYLTGTAFSLRADTDYLIIGNGQSLMQGAKNSSAGDATVTTSAQHPGKALMFNPGVRPAGAGITGYVDLFEQDKSSSFETSMSGAADVIMTRLQARLGFKPRIIFATACAGGQAYSDPTSAVSGLKRGTDTYAEAIRLVKAAKDLSASQGRKLVVLAQVIIHGEEDFKNGLSKALYMRALDQWNANVNEDWRAITGQAEPVRTYVTQTNRTTVTLGSPAQVALAQLAIEDRNPLIRCCGPIYQSPGGVPEDGNDGAHLTALGYRMVGRLTGHFLSQDLLGAYEQPLRVIDSWWVSSTVARLKYSKPIAIETTNALINVTGVTVGSTTYAGLGADGGVKFTDGSGSPPTVSGIAVVSGATDTLEVTLSSAPSGKDPRLTVASYRPDTPTTGLAGTGSGRGPRSAIRSASAFDTDALTGVTHYFWACQEQVRLPPI